MKLKKYQDKAVSKLYAKARALLAKPGSRICVFKAPTGSGKTIMVAEFLLRLGADETHGRYAFLWISGHNLHVQSQEKVSPHLADSRYSLLLLDEISETSFGEDQIVFVNWESLTKQDSKTGEFKNVLMKETETGRSLQSLVANTRETGVEIILIVDESQYHYWSKKSQELVQGIIAPKLILEVSATPEVVPSQDEIDHEEAGYISVKFEDVVGEGMIKESIIVNEAISSYSDFHNTEDEVIIEASLAKREALCKLYDEEEISVNPLMLIQLPSESQTLSALDKSKLEELEGILLERHGITTKNGKLAVWLSDRKDNIDRISENNSDVEVLIFKQAIALGWDCPRAQILLMFRDIKVKTFEIQTVGRIMRMPEARHYGCDALNQAYVYTNLDRVTIAHDGTSEGYFKVYRAVRKPTYKPLDLPSFYLSRIDFGDLTLSFRVLFIKEANTYFGIADKDTSSKAKQKVDAKLDLRLEELTKVVISDAVIKNLDEQARKEIIGAGKAEFKVSPDEIKRAYEVFAKATSLPYAPVRSHTKIQQAIYDWFDKQIGYSRVSRLEIQRIVIGSENNQKVFKEIIESTKERFKKLDREEKSTKQRKKEIVWNVPEIDYFNEQYELVDSERAVLVSAQHPDKTPLYVRRSAPEKAFEEVLNGAKSVTWWYKNGDSKEIYFAIPYKDPRSGFGRSFYPDYIVRFSDGSIGIYDTKEGFTRDSEETAAKSDALQANLAKLRAKNIKKIRGGIVWHRPAGLFIYEGEIYTLSEDQWKKLVL